MQVEQPSWSETVTNPTPIPPRRGNGSSLPRNGSSLPPQGKGKVPPKDKGTIRFLVPTGTGGTCPRLRGFEPARTNSFKGWVKCLRSKGTNSFLMTEYGVIRFYSFPKNESPLFDAITSPLRSRALGRGLLPSPPLALGTGVASPLGARTSHCPYESILSSKLSQTCTPQGCLRVYLAEKHSTLKTQNYRPRATSLRSTPRKFRGDQPPPRHRSPVNCQLRSTRPKRVVSTAKCPRS